MKFESDGAVAWAKGFIAAGNSNIEREAITVDATGNVYLSGQITQPLSLGGPVLQPGRFLAKFSPTGTHLLFRNTRPEPGTLFAIYDFEPAPNGDILALAALVRTSDGHNWIMVIRYAAETLEAKWTKVLLRTAASSSNGRSRLTSSTGPISPRSSTAQ